MNKEMYANKLKIKRSLLHYGIEHAWCSEYKFFTLFIYAQHYDCSFLEAEYIYFYKNKIFLCSEHLDNESMNYELDEVIKGECSMKVEEVESLKKLREHLIQSRTNYKHNGKKLK